MTQELRSRRWAAVRGGMYVMVLALTITGVYLVTRGKPATATESGHAHAAAAPGTGAPRAVILTATEAQRIGVTYAVASIGPFVKEVRTVGQITFDETRVRTVSPKVDGWVERLIVNATGQPVSAGQPLLTIYSPMLVAAQEELLLARRLRTELAGGDDEAVRHADDLIAAARRRLAYWDIGEREIAALETSGEVKKVLTLASPASGFVLEKRVLAGQRIMAGDALFTVADLSTVWIEGEVFENDLAAVRVGQPVRAEFQALPGEERAGRIAYIYPTLDPETRTARVRVVVPNGALRLKPGMYATIRIAAQARANALTVPRSAVLSTGERNLVFVRDSGGRLVPHEVAIGSANDARVEILRGLSPGDTVVASATFLVDAESNLGTALGGMGDMPGMDMTTPPKPLPARKKE